jgi:hypothetical protein
MEPFPLEFKYVITCRNPKAIYNAIHHGIRFEMLNLASVEIWDHMDAIRDYVNAGGVITIADLTFAVANINCNLEEVLCLVGSDIFDAHEDDMDEYGCYKSTNEITVFQSLTDEDVGKLIRSKAILVESILCNKRKTILKDLDTVFDWFGDKCYISPRILNYCFLEQQNTISHEIIHKLIERDAIDQNGVLSHIFDSFFLRRIGIKNLVKEDMLMKILQNMDISSILAHVASDSIWTGYLSIVQYFVSNGFNVFSNKTNNGSRINAWLHRCSIEFLDWIRQNGCDLSYYCRHFRVEYICGSIEEGEIDKINWLVDNVVAGDDELMNIFKKESLWLGVPAKIKLKIGIEN